MDWPELVEALKLLGFRHGYAGKWMYHSSQKDSRRVECLFGGRARVMPNWRPMEEPSFEGPFAEVVAYLQKVEKEKKP